MCANECVVMSVVCWYEYLVMSVCECVLMRVCDMWGMCVGMCVPICVSVC